MNKRAAAVALAFAVTLFAAFGCGDDTSVAEPLTKAALVREADAICKRVNTRVKALAAPGNREEAVRVLDKTVEITQEGLGAIKELRPPSALETVYDAWVEKIEALVDTAKQARDAAKRDDEQTFQDALAKGNRLNRDAKRAARKVGLRECGRSR
jgi:hypothetical protein